MGDVRFVSCVFRGKLSLTDRDLFVPGRRLSASQPCRRQWNLFHLFCQCTSDVHGLSLSLSLYQCGMATLRARMFVGITRLPAHSGPLVGRHEQHFCDIVAGQSYVRALRTLGIVACGPGSAVREGVIDFIVLALGETHRACAIVAHRNMIPAWSPTVNYCNFSGAMFAV